MRTLFLMLLALVSLALAPGCLRLGFSEAPDALAPLDGPPDGPLDGGLADAPLADHTSADRQLAGLNEHCSDGGCVVGLVCTGKPGQTICRQGCGDGGCPDGEICGKPTGVSSVPLACLTNQTVGIYEDCSAIPCGAGLSCLKGTAGSACFKACTSVTECAANESCVPSANSPLSYCVPRCTSDADCPGTTLVCVGDGPYPYDHCAPLTTVAAFAACTPTTPCGPGYRCTGQPGQTQYCYKACPAGAGVTCASDELCVKINTAVELCLRACDPLDSPVKCRTIETCYADGALLKAYCIPVVGDATSCTASVPCVTGKLCVGTSCKPACDSSHPCATGTCTKLNYQGTDLPWQACN